MKKESTSKVKKMRLHLRGVKSGKGFTLVEILVTIAIVAIVGTIMVLIFTNTLRGSNKSQILSAIKQNGQAVLENMDKTIRSADKVVCPSSGASETLAIVKNGFYTRYRFKQDSGVLTIVQDNPVMSSGSLQTFLTDICTANDYPGASKISLIDTSSISGVTVTANPLGSFTRNKQPGFKDSVTISFILGPGVGLPAAISGQIDPVAFQTTIELR